MTIKIIKHFIIKLKNKGIPGPKKSKSTVLQKNGSFLRFTYLFELSKSSEFSSLGPKLQDYLCFKAS